MTDAIGDARAIAERILLGNIAERVWGGTSRRVLLTGGMKYLELWGRDCAASMSALPAALLPTPTTRSSSTTSSAAPAALPRAPPNP